MKSAVGTSSKQKNLEFFLNARSRNIISNDRLEQNSSSWIENSGRFTDVKLNERFLPPHLRRVFESETSQQ